MIRAFKEFLRDEAGAVTIDSIIVMGGSIWMAAAVVTDISVATLDVTAKINERLEYASIIAEIVGEYGPGGAQDTGSECAGGANPGNDKCVGNSGEDPNGSGDWGSGSNGQSS